MRIIFILAFAGLLNTLTVQVAKAQSPSISKVTKKSYNGSDVSCYGIKDAELTVVAVPGQAPLTYSMNGGAYQASNIFSNLGSGHYYFVAKNSQGNVSNRIDVDVYTPNRLQITSIYNSGGTYGGSVSCFGTSDGSFGITADGGTGAKLASKDNGANYQSSFYFDKLNAATYNVKIKDANGCEDAGNYTVKGPAQISAAFNQTDFSCASSTGTVVITPGGGSPGYSYKVDGTDTWSTTFSNLKVGNHSVKITDNHNCTSSIPFTVVNPPAPTISYSGTPYCSSEGTASVSLSGATGGTFSSDSKLSINASTGAVNLSASSEGVHTVTYTPNGGCSAQTATTTITINATPSVSATTTFTCVGGNSGTITATGTGGTSPYSFNLNGGTYQSSGFFTKRAEGTYTLGIKSKNGCVATTSVVVSPYPNSADDQNAAGTEAWIGHIYDGTDFEDYKGHFNEPADFDENFGGSGTCFDYTSNSGNGSINTESFSVKFKMKTSKKGLYVVDLGGDDGVRLFIDGTLYFDNWIQQSFVVRPSVLISLTGNSTLDYEYFENGYSNRVIFQNLTPVLPNTLSQNTEQSICMGTSGVEISGDTFGELPSRISLSGTGYQWTYSTTANGTRTNIPGATGATFTPNSSSAPFNVPGTYFVYRNAILNSSNNLPGGGGYTASNESNVAKITINAIPSASISYANTPFCNSSSNVGNVTITGTKGGTFSATGLNINSSTGAIVAISNPVGQYTVKYTINTPGCSQFNTSTQVYIGAPGTWSGKLDNNWNNSGNWICGEIPTFATDATIPVTSNNPAIPAGESDVNNITINSGASLTVLGTLKISGSIQNNGTFDVTKGTLEFDGGPNTITGARPQTISGSWFVNKTINNLIISNTKGLSLFSTPNDTLNITGILSFGKSNCAFNTNNNLTLKSNANATAGVADMTNNGALRGNSINGNVTVERYINIGNLAGQHNKTWIMVATPTEGKSIYETWMEDGNKTVSGYGTQITGKGTGFDATSVAPALKYFDDATNNWIGVTNTNNPVYNPLGYMLFVRGDRTTAYPRISNTTLRTTGTLLTGSTTPVNVKAGKFQSIGNPYASAVDIRKISATGINPDVIVWDPTLTIGNPYGVGAYQTLYKDGNNYRNLLASSTFGPAGTVNNNIESGMAFFVQSFDTDGQVYFTESAKASNVGKGIAMREQTSSDDAASLSASLYAINTDGSTYVTDGTIQQFGSQYSDKIDGMDTRKILNSTENLSINSDGEKLVVERRGALTSEDTIRYNLTGVTNKKYRFIFNASGISTAAVNGFIEDSYAKTETPLNADGETQLDFAVTSDAASKAANRFKIVFKSLRTTPVTFTSVKANAQDNKISVEWNVENQSNMKQYEVERSNDGNKFSQVAVLEANNNSSSSYSWLDENPFNGNNFYRIRSIDLNGKIEYTSIVKAQINNISVSIKVYPNPATEARVNIQLTNQPTGVYYAQLFNPLGQVMVSKKIIHTAGNSIETIQWNESAARGIYNLQITMPDGSAKVIKIKY